MFRQSGSTSSSSVTQLFDYHGADGGGRIRATVLVCVRLLLQPFARTHATFAKSKCRNRVEANKNEGKRKFFVSNCHQKRPLFRWEILRRLQQSPRQIACAMHDAFNAQRLTSDPIENQVHTKTPTDREGANASEFRCAESP